MFGTILGADNSFQHVLKSQPSSSTSRPLQTHQPATLSPGAEVKVASPKSSLVNNNIKEVAMMSFNNKVIYVKVPLVLMIDINTKVNVLN